MKERIEKVDQLLSVLYKYELHAFVLLVTGAVLTLRGHSDIGFSIITAACTIFKGKAQ